MTYSKNETITAISTPLGEGAISIVRLSGVDAISIADKIFSKDVKKIKSHMATLGKILDKDNKLVDTAVVIVYLAPNSYTGENIVEIQGHGGSLVTQRVYETTIEAGARPANPGEFTLRAFLNRKIDLTQAEAIQDLISAKNKYALNAAKNQLDGFLFKEIKKYQKELTDVAAIIEAWVDFPEEGLEFASMKELLSKLTNTLLDMQKLSDTFNEGQIIKEGLSLCIIGGVNVGKSSLMNLLLRQNRAIVSDISGTTRDVLREDLQLNNLHYKLIDTAGIRKTNCPIETEGITRSQKELDRADIILLVLDASKKLDDDDKELLESIKNKKAIVIWNKIDLQQPTTKIDYPNILHLSAKENLGLDNLYKMLENLTFKSKISQDEIIITKKRHKLALDEAIDHLKKVIQNLKEDISAEFISIDLKDALKALSKIIGFDITEDILSSIFSKFCIGK